MTNEARLPTVGRFGAGLVGVFVLTTVGWMGLWAAVTTFFYGSAPVVVSSGSMAPALDVGDLVVVEPYHGQRVHTGTVVVFDDPVGGRSTIHRVVEVLDDGSFTTRGDANPAVDSVPVQLAEIDSSGRFLLPRMGLPVVWAQQGQWLFVVLALGGLAAAVWLARFALFDAHDPWLAGAAPRAGPAPSLREQVLGAWSGTRDAMRHRGSAGDGAGGLAAGVAGGVVLLARRRTAELAAITLALVLAHGTVTAYAAFADTTVNTGNQFGAGSLTAPSGFGVAAGPCAGASTISFRSATAGANTSGDQIVLSRPAGVQTGDVLIAGITWHTHNYSGSLIDPPAGWQLIRIDTEFSHTVQGLFWKAVTGSEPATYTFTNGTTDLTREVVGGIAAYSGVDTTTPVNAHAGLTQTSSVSTMVAPSVTSTVESARLVTVFGQHSPGPFSPPGGMVERYAVGIGSGGRSMTTLLADEVLGGPGATGTRTASSAANGSGVGQSVVLDPAGGVESAMLSWAPSASSFVDGYLVQRYIGPVLDGEWLVTPGSASSLVDFGGLVGGTSYTYRIRSTAGTWRSPPVSATYDAARC